MTTEYENMEPENQLNSGQLSHNEYQRKYNRTRLKQEARLIIKPSLARQLREYYKEYVTTSQQDLYIPVDFHTFIIQFAEIGFMAWKERHKGK